MIKLDKKNIIVTGASGGIGNSIVKRLNDCGANILASGTKTEKLDKLKSLYPNIKVMKFDISQTEKIEDFIENATNEIGGNFCSILKLIKLTDKIEEY